MTKAGTDLGGPIPGTLYRRLDEDGDTGFLMSTWLKSWTDGERDTKGLRPGKFFAVYRFVIGRLLRTANVAVVCDEQDPSSIVGWMCWSEGEEPVVHYVYVKNIYRGMGCMTAMLAELGVTAETPFRFTFMAVPERKVSGLRSRYPLATYSPELLAGLVEESGEERSR